MLLISFYEKVSPDLIGYKSFYKKTVGARGVRMACNPPARHNIGNYYRGCSQHAYLINFCIQYLISIQYKFTIIYANRYRNSCQSYCYNHSSIHWETYSQIHYQNYFIKLAVFSCKIEKLYVKECFYIHRNVKYDILVYFSIY